MKFRPVICHPIPRLTIIFSSVVIRFCASYANLSEEKKMKVCDVQNKFTSRESVGNAELIAREKWENAARSELFFKTCMGSHSVD